MPSDKLSSSVASGASSPRWRLARPLFSFWMVLPMMEGSLRRSGQLSRASLEGHRTRLWENRGVGAIRYAWGMGSIRKATVLVRRTV